MIANFAHILRKVVPEKDFVGRFGGDEFIAILYDTTSGQADELLEKTTCYDQTVSFQQYAGCDQLRLWLQLLHELQRLYAPQSA